LIDATFDASDVFNHCAQLLVSMKERQVPFLLVLQMVDGGPARLHNLTVVQAQLSLVVMFLELKDIQKRDHLVVIRGCPQGSYFNKVEHGMSILNLGLQDHISIKRGDMPNWVENKEFILHQQ
jgi:hypothetical protein